MNAKLLSICMFLVWFSLGIVLLFRKDIFKSEYVPVEREQNYQMMVFAAFALSFWNLFRFFIRSRADRARKQTLGYRYHSKTVTQEESASVQALPETPEK